MKLAAILKSVKSIGRFAIGGGLATAGTVTALGADEWIAMIGAGTALIGALTELVVKGFEAWGKATGRIKPV